MLLYVIKNNHGRLEGGRIDNAGPSNETAKLVRARHGLTTGANIQIELAEKRWVRYAVIGSAVRMQGETANPVEA